MSKSKKLGIAGEKLATDFLKSKGYRIIATNYRFKRAEIDIICEKDELLTFVEVKTRSNNDYGNPEQAVDGQKISKIREAAENYIFTENWTKNIRFDIISIRVIDQSDWKITHLKDAII